MSEHHPAPGEPPALHRTLSARQINMVAIGGIIGTGLFVGSGLLVSSTGPAVIFAYLAMGVVIVFLMRMLGEMAVDAPDSGSYAAYATREIGAWAGAMCTYIAIYGGIVVTALEVTIVGVMMNGIVPGVSAAWWATIAAALLVGLNFLEVRVFAEVEFWLAVVKVVAILAFIAVGVLAFAGVLPGVESPGLRNWAPMAPGGWSAVAAACVTVIFAYVGAEQVVVLAAESADPATATRRAIRSVVTRILLFYIGSILIVITFVPFSSPRLGAGAYLAVLETLGLERFGILMTGVILFSLLSLTNTTIYTTSRMIFAAAGRGELPGALSGTTRQGAPGRAVLIVGAVALALVSANFFMDAVSLLTLLMAFVGASAVITYSVVVVSQLRFRRRLSPGQVSALRVRTWLHPWGAIATLVVLGLVLLALASSAEMRISVVLTLVLAAACALTGRIVQSRLTRSGRPSAPPLAGTTLGNDSTAEPA